MSRSQVQINSHTLSQFGMGKVFKYPSNTVINGLDIDASGRYLVCTSSDNNLRLYDCLDAKLKKSIECKKYGASSVHFTHHSKAILIASPFDYSIKYHSLHDNSYIRTFVGHRDRITSIKMCFLDDTFLSASIDRHIRLWDLRQPQCIGLCKVNGRPTIAQDNEGLIFGIGTGKNNELKLYDRRKYQNGPFETFGGATSYFPKINYEWCDIKFSPDNKHILISTRTNLLFLVDAYKGNVVEKYTKYKNEQNEDIVGSFTANGKFVCCGSSNGDIHFWKKNDNEDSHPIPINELPEGHKITQWRGHPNSIKYFKFNSRYLTAVSAAQHIALWIPKMNTNSNKNNNNNNNNKNKGLLKKTNKNNNNNNNQQK